MHRRHAFSRRMPRRHTFSEHPTREKKMHRRHAFSEHAARDGKSPLRRKSSVTWRAQKKERSQFNASMPTVLNPVSCTMVNKEQGGRWRKIIGSDDGQKGAKKIVNGTQHPSKSCTAFGIINQRTNCLGRGNGHSAITASSWEAFRTPPRWVLP
jgi:hypothetical protein